jgi:hypothetical protein
LILLALRKSIWRAATIVMEGSKAVTAMPSMLLAGGCILCAAHVPFTRSRVRVFACLRVRVLPAAHAGLLAGRCWHLRSRPLMV